MHPRLWFTYKSVRRHFKRTWSFHNLHILELCFLCTLIYIVCFDVDCGKRNERERQNETCICFKCYFIKWIQNLRSNWHFSQYQHTADIELYSKTYVDICHWCLCGCLLLLSQWAIFYWFFILTNVVLFFSQSKVW